MKEESIFLQCTKSCDNYNIKLFNKSNKKDEVQTVNSEECRGQVIGQARVSDRRCTVLVGSRPQGHIARVKGRDTEVVRAEISRFIVIGRPS